MIHILTNNKDTEYKEIINNLARKVGEEVCVLRDTPGNISKLFEGVNYANGRTIIFRPSFIPSPSFFEEIDYLYEQDVHVVVPSAYTATFNPEEDVPYEMYETGVSHDFIVFQLMGQKEFVIPRGFHWGYLENVNNSRVYRLESRYCGNFKNGFSLRSSLGDIIPGIRRHTKNVFLGKDAVGGDAVTDRVVQKRLARAAIEALRIWLV